MFETLVAKTVRAPIADSLGGKVQQRVNLLVLEHLLAMSYDSEFVPETQAQARAIALSLDTWLQARIKANDASSGHYRYLSELIEKAAHEQAFKRRSMVAEIPPGAPI